MKQRFDVIFLISGLVVQVLVFWLAPTHWLSLVSGLLGITSVILCSQGNIWTFAFGFGQIVTYAILCWMERFYAGIVMNVFYFLTQIYGIYAWRQRLVSHQQSAIGNQQSAIIVPRTMATRQFLTLCAVVAVVSLGVGWLLSLYTDDTQPYMDAVTTLFSVAAQILLIMAIRQQWWLWLLVDVLFVAMWINAGNWSMVAQYSFWCINCVYGLLRWKELATK